MTSGAFTEAYQQLVQQFQKATHHTVVTTFGASMGGAQDSIPVRLGRGEPVDVVIVIESAFEPLIKAGHIVPASRVQLARSVIGVAVERVRRSRTSARSPRSGRRCFRRSRSRIRRVQAARMSRPSCSRGSASRTRSRARRSALKASASEQSSRAAMPRSAFNRSASCCQSTGIEYLGPLPSEVQQVSVMTAAVATKSASPAAAKALIDFLASPAAAATIHKTGLEPVASLRQRGNEISPLCGPRT